MLDVDSVMAALEASPEAQVAVVRALLASDDVGGLATRWHACRYLLEKVTIGEILNTVQSSPEALAAIRKALPA